MGTVKPSSGPHKQGETLPVGLFLRNRLKYAITMKEVETIMKQRLIKIDGKTRTDPKFPTGFMDVVQIDKTGENFRIIYDVKGRFTIRYPDPNAKVNDSIQLDLATNKVQDIITFEVGNLVMVTGGANAGRVGTMISREKHPGSFDICHIKDSQGHVFATRLNYV